MADHDDLRPELRQGADRILQRLSAWEREALLVKCWMSHDARWFMAVAQQYGLQAANHVNRIAAHEIGKVEAQRIGRALRLPPATTLDEYLLAQEVFINLLGPDLLDYVVERVGDHAYRTGVRRCFAYDNAVRAGIAEHFECGVFARVTGWLEGLGLSYEMSPALGKCLKAQGQECVHTITLGERAAAS
jgi:hypothetical protein